MSRPDRALVFDLDGVLIDSEPLWRRAEIEVFGDVGLALEERDCLKTQGLRIDETVAYWYARAPWRAPTPERVAHAIVDRVAALIEREGVPMSGVDDAIAAARARGWRLGLASSSSMRLIGTVLDRFDMRGAFECIRSAEHETRGKPYPDVYRSAIRELDLAADACIAIEDSAHGVAAARAAGMRCIAVPAPETRSDERFAQATWRIESLEALPSLLDQLEGPSRQPRP